MGNEGFVCMTDLLEPPVVNDSAKSDIFAEVRLDEEKSAKLDIENGKPIIRLFPPTPHKTTPPTLFVNILLLCSDLP